MKSGALHSASLRQQLSRGLPRDKSDTLLLIGACALVMIPHAWHLPAWVTLAAGALLLWRGWITFRGNKLHPRDAELMARMHEVSPVLTRQTTMWKTWIGFNASHSYGALLFGAVYGYLALFHSTFLFQSRFLLGLGLVFLAGWLVLGKLYWFSVPFRGIALATALYVAGLIALLF